MVALIVGIATVVNCFPCQPELCGQPTKGFAPKPLPGKLRVQPGNQMAPWTLRDSRDSPNAKP
jgi:hypothetical protein